jgi:parallel beta-helix repeat protein
MNRPTSHAVQFEDLEKRELLTTFYVSPSGSDSNAGSSAAPFLTLQKAADRVAAGDTVIARAGTYAAGFTLGWDAPTAGTAAAPITFQADPNAAPGSVIITGRSKVASGIDLEDGCDWIVIKGFTVNNASGLVTGAGIRVSGSDNVSVLDNTLDHCGGFGIFSSFATNLLIQGNTVTNTIGGKSTTGHGIYVSNSAVNPVVRNNVIANNNNQGLQFNGDASMGGSGIVTGALVENNIIRNSGSNGMNCDGLQNSRIQNNLIYNNNSNGITLFKIDGAQGSKNNLIINNTFYAPSSIGAAVRIKDGSTGNKVYNNILIGNTASVRISNDSLSGLISDYNAVMDSFVSEDTGASQSLSSWRTQTGQDQHSFIATAAQLFVDAGGNDYHLSAVSPAIDTGTNLGSPNQAPTNDFESNMRPSGAAWDIGAYEHSSAPDTTPPQLSAINATNVLSNKATIAWTTDELADSQVDFGTSGYTNSSPLDATFTTNHAVTLTGLSPATLYHYRVKSRDASGNPATSDDFTFTTAGADTTPPTFSNVAFTSLTPNSTAVAWTTDEVSDTQVRYGFSSNYGNTSTLNASLTTSHNLTLSGLVPGTRYHLQLLSRDDSGNLGTSSDLVFTTSSPNAIPSGAAAFWPFNESSGTTTADSTGNNHAGTLQNGALFTAAGQTGNAVSFDGVDDSVRIARAASLEPAVVSLAAWIKIPSGVIEADWASVIKKTYGNDLDEPWGSWGLQLSPNGAANRIGFFTGIPGTDGNTLLSPSALPTNAWVHVAATYDPANSAKDLYVNGQLVASTTLLNPIVYDSTSSGDIYLGQDPGGGEAFAGTIDSVGIWGRVLSPGEIAAMVATPVTQAINGTTSSDTILITRASPQQIQAQVNHQAPSAIDLNAVNIVQVNGSSGTDTLVITGLSGNDDVLINAGDVRFGSTLITQSSIQRVNFDGAGGSDTLTIDGASVKLPTAQVLSGLTVLNSGRVDVADTILTINYAPGADPISSIVGLIRTGFNNGAWNGPGINTSFGDASQFGLGFIDLPAHNQIEIALSSYGDATVDGVVNSLDFNALAINFGGSGKSWADGDFNFDGNVNALDFNLLASNYGSASPSPAQQSIASSTALPSVRSVFASAPATDISARDDLLDVI